MLLLIVNNLVNISLVQCNPIALSRGMIKARLARGSTLHDLCANFSWAASAVGVPAPGPHAFGNNACRARLRRHVPEFLCGKIGGGRKPRGERRRHRFRSSRRDRRSVAASSTRGMPGRCGVGATAETGAEKNEDHCRKLCRAGSVGLVFSLVLKWAGPRAEGMRCLTLPESAAMCEAGNLQLCASPNTILGLTDHMGGVPAENNTVRRSAARRPAGPLQRRQYC